MVHSFGCYRKGATEKSAALVSEEGANKTRNKVPQRCRFDWGGFLLVFIPRAIWPRTFSIFH